MNFDNKIPLALIVTVLLQAGGIIWWVSQQAQTVEILKEEVGTVASRMAIEKNVNLQRDVADHGRTLENMLEEMKRLHAIGDHMAAPRRRLSVVETQLKFMDERGR